MTHDYGATPRGPSGRRGGPLGLGEGFDQVIPPGALWWLIEGRGGGVGCFFFQGGNSKLAGNPRNEATHTRALDKKERGSDRYKSRHSWVRRAEGWEGRRKKEKRFRVYEGAPGYLRAHR